MRSRIAVVAILIMAALFGLGIWRGWFEISGQRMGDTKGVNVDITIDQDKIDADAARMRKSLEDVPHGKKNETDTQNKD